jgi:hypothetical protein
MADVSKLDDRNVHYPGSAQKERVAVEILSEAQRRNFQYLSETVSTVTLFDRTLLSPILCRQVKDRDKS